MHHRLRKAIIKSSIEGSILSLNFMKNCLTETTTRINMKIRGISTCNVINVSTLPTFQQFASRRRMQQSMCQWTKTETARKTCEPTKSQTSSPTTISRWSGRALQRPGWLSRLLETRLGAILASATALDRAYSRWIRLSSASLRSSLSVPRQKRPPRIQRLRRSRIRRLRPQTRGKWRIWSSSLETAMNHSRNCR